MPEYVVETYLARGDRRERLSCEQRAKTAAAELTRQGRRIRLRSALHVPEDEMSFFVFEAPTVEDAALAASSAGLAPLRIVTAEASNDVAGRPGSERTRTDEPADRRPAGRSEAQHRKGGRR